MGRYGWAGTGGALLSYRTLVCDASLSGDGSPRRGPRLGAEMAFEAEQQVIQLYAKFCALQFMETVWARLQSGAAITSDEWMLFLSQSRDAPVAIKSLDAFDPSLSLPLRRAARSGRIQQGEQQRNYTLACKG